MRSFPFGDEARRPHDRDGGDRDGERRGIDPVRGREPERRDQDAGERRADDRRHPEVHLIERRGGGYEPPLHERWCERRPGGRVERTEACSDRGEGVQEPDRRDAELRREREPEGREQETQLRDEQEPATVGAIGDDAAEQRQR